MGKVAEKEVADLFGAVGAFLAEHRLSPEPVHYAFAYQVISDPDGPLARSVAQITDGGVRLRRQDIQNLGGDAIAGAPVGSDSTAVEAARSDSPDPARDTQEVISQTERQMAAFSATVRSIHAETSGFGRDLAASAAAIRAADPGGALDQITELTGTMISRVHDAERRLAEAERETDVLREALDEALGAARHDPLTTLANRRAFDEACAALSPETVVVVALCDVDHFKRVNDEFGHAVGDRVLRAVGQTLAAESEGALVARYGGEEFVFLMTNVSMTQALEIVDRARNAVAARRFRSRETDAPIGTITISAGVAGGRAAEACSTLYARADAALYRAKATGRNKVLFAG